MHIKIRKKEESVPITACVPTTPPLTLAYSPESNCSTLLYSI